MCTIIVESFASYAHDVDTNEGITDDGDRIDMLARQYRNSGPLTILVHIKPKYYGVRDNLYAKLIPKLQISNGFLTGPTISPLLTPRASLPYLARGAPSPLYTGSSQSLRLVKEWLDRCVKTHTTCRTSAARQLPSRLLHIAGRGQETEVQLVRTDTLPVGADVRYVALSYCWGSQSTQKLTVSTEKSLVQGVKARSLPQTIKDAIAVASELGLSWIWVDSLCIIQDSAEDWKREAARMCDVYLGCFLCIAARGASNNSEGLFAFRDPFRQSPCVIVARDGEDYVAAWPPLRASRPWPLEARGWVLQERTLPPRMVKYGSYICWECRESDVDEFGLETHAQFPAFAGALERIIREFYATVVQKPQSGQVADDRIVLKMWRALVSEYSSTTLSFIADRYAAINGLVSAIQRSRGWIPKWGLWQTHMFNGLCWTVVSESKVGRTGVGPTWSWLSVDGQVIYYPEPRHALPEYVNLALVVTEGLSKYLDGHPLDLHDKAIKIVARLLHGQGAVDSDHGYCLVVEWGHAEVLPKPWKIHWRLDLRDPQRYNMADCLFLPLQTDPQASMIEGIMVTPSPTYIGLFERCGDWSIYLQERMGHSKDAYRSAVNRTLSLPQEAVIII